MHCLNSAASRARWLHELKHIYRAPFATFYLDRIKPADVPQMESLHPHRQEPQGRRGEPRHANNWLGLTPARAKRGAQAGKGTPGR